MNKRYLLGALVLLALRLSVVAQTSILTPYTPQNGTIDAPDTAQTYTFAAPEGAVVSLHAVSRTDSFDPVLALANGAGTVLVTNDDYNYPDGTNALLQAVTLPRTDTYRVTVSGYDGSTGDYTLTLTYGYADLVLSEDFADAGNWRASGGDVTLQALNGGLFLETAGGAGGIAIDPESETLSDFYARVQLANISSTEGWTVGMVLRQEGANAYRVEVNDRGQWRMVRAANDEETVIRDWTEHPAIVNDETAFSLGVLAHGAGFDVFYNEAFVGQAVDDDEPLTAGRIGFYVRATSTPGSAASAGFDNLAVTTPLLNNGAEIMPSILMPGVQALTVQELERRRVIPVGGTSALNVAESFTRDINPGVNRNLLGDEVTFAEAVIAASFEIEAGIAGMTGCGLLFDHISETDYALAYLDGTGAYGMSKRDGEAFAPGLYGENPDWVGDTQSLLVVRLDEVAHLFVNRTYVGTLPLPESRGAVGNANVNFEAIDTACQFADLWVWSLP